MLRWIIEGHRPLEANSARGRWVDLEDNFVPVQGQRDAVSRSSQVGEREEQVALGLKDDPALFQELAKRITAQNALRHRGRHQIAAGGLVADGASEAIRVRQRILGGGDSASRTKDPHQLKPGIGLHDEGRGTGSTDSSTQGRSDDVDERKGIGVIHKIKRGPPPNRQAAP